MIRRQMHEAGSRGKTHLTDRAYLGLFSLYLNMADRVGTLISKLYLMSKVHINVNRVGTFTPAGRNTLFKHGGQELTLLKSSLKQ